MICRCTLHFCLVVFAICCLPTLLQAEINAPFGLMWGESQERLTELLKGAKAKIVEKREIDKREAWTVEGLIQPGLKRTIFYFKSNVLVEVELQYENPEWDTAKYDAFMSQVKKKIEERYGEGKRIAHEKAPAGDVMQTVVGYQWVHEASALQLFYYSAEKDQNVFRTVSLHYKAL